MFLAVETFRTLATLIQRMIYVFGFVLFEFVFARKLHVTVIAFEGTQVAVTRERMTLQMKHGLE